MASNSPQLVLPGNETVTAGSTLAIGGIAYSDSFASANPGAMYLRIWDSAGLLSATDAAGANCSRVRYRAITLGASYADVTAVLASLSYAAAARRGPTASTSICGTRPGVKPPAVSRYREHKQRGQSRPPTVDRCGQRDWNAGGNWSAARRRPAAIRRTFPGGTPNNPVLSGATLTGETISLTRWQWRRRFGALLRCHAWVPAPCCGMSPTRRCRSRR